MILSYQYNVVLGLHLNNETRIANMGSVYSVLIVFRKIYNELYRGMVQIIYTLIPSFF